MDLKTFRKNNGWTLEHMAKLLGLSNGSVVHRHETGASVPTIEVQDRYRLISDGAVTVGDFILARKAFKARAAREAASAKASADRCDMELSANG